MVNVEFCNDMIVGATEIRDDMLKLDSNETCVTDNIYITVTWRCITSRNHIKYVQ